MRKALMILACIVLMAGYAHAGWFLSQIRHEAASGPTALFSIDPYTSGTLTDSVSAGTMTVVRNSLGTYSDSTGCYAVAVNTGRFDDGCIFEPAVTNTIKNSEDLTIVGVEDGDWFSGVGTGNCTITSDATTSPLAGVNADAICAAGTNETHYIYTFQPASQGDVWVSSAFLKAGVKTSAFIGITYLSAIFAPLAGGNVTIDLTTGGTSAWGATVLSAEDVGGGWYRLGIRIAAVAPATTVYVLSSYGIEGGAYLGTGAEDLYLWGGQLEESLYLTEYVRTAGAPVTTAEEYAEINIPAAVATAVGVGQEGTAVAKLQFSIAHSGVAGANYCPAVGVGASTDPPMVSAGSDGTLYGVFSADSNPTSVTVTTTWSADAVVWTGITWGSGLFRALYRKSIGDWTAGGDEAFAGFTVDGANKLVVGRKYGANAKVPFKILELHVWGTELSTADLNATYGF